MQSINYAWKLKCFVPQNQSPYALLESLDYLRQRGHLGPLWFALEQGIEDAFRASEANKGWAWHIDGTMSLFDMWNFNRKSPDTLYAKNRMLPQLEMAKAALDKIVRALDPPTDAMIDEMSLTIIAIEKKFEAQLRALLDDMV